MVQWLLNHPEIDIFKEDSYTRYFYENHGKDPVGSNTHKQTAAEVARTDEIKQIIEQRIKAADVKKQSSYASKEKINEQIAELFHSYAYPPLFSWNWRSGYLQKIADEISKELSEKNRLDD